MIPVQGSMCVTEQAGLLTSSPLAAAFPSHGWQWRWCRQGPATLPAEVTAAGPFPISTGFPI